jgi:hypothetical protein
MIHIRGKFCQVIPSKVSQTKMCRKSTKSSIKNNRVPLQGSMAGQTSVWNMPANSKRGLEHVTILHEVCVSVAQ